MSAELIYKTTSPAAIAWWEKAKAERARVHELRVAYIDKATEQFGVTPPAYTGQENPPTEREMIVMGPRVSGLASGHREQPPAGSGWRLDSKDSYWKPALNTKAGKAVRAELDTLVGYDLRDHLPEIGGAKMAFAESRLYQPGLEFDEDTQTLYQIWSSGHCAKDAEDEASRVREVVWEEVPRSAWFAREEAKAAAAA